MAYVGRTDHFGPSFSVSASAGDVLVAVVEGAGTFPTLSSESQIGVPTGWVKHGLWMMSWRDAPSAVFGGTAYLFRPLLFVASFRVASTGTVSGTFEFPPHYLVIAVNTRVFRLSGMRGVPLVSATRLNAQRMTWPAASGRPPAASGHAIRLALTDAWPAPGALTPSDHTSRLSATVAEMNSGEKITVDVSERSLSSALPAVAQATLTNRVSGWAVTLYVASALGPHAPTITAPASGAVADLTLGLTVAWTHDPTLAGAQAGVRITRRLLPSGTVQYLQAGGGWTGTPTTITTGDASRAIAGTGFTAGGAQWQFTVATVGVDSPDVGDAASVTVTSWAPPTASAVTYHGASSGTLADAAARAGWLAGSGSAGSGSTLDLVQVQIVDWDTGEVYVSGEHAPGWWLEPGPEGWTDLPNNVDVRLRVRVRQNGSQWSDWLETSSPITIAVPVPDPPVLTVTPVEHPVSGLPGTRVTITGTVPSGRTFSVRLWRDGILLDSWPITDSGVVTIDDYSLLVGGEYTATLTDDASPPNTSILSSPVSCEECELEPGWLVDPIYPDRAVRVLLLEPIGIEHVIEAQTFSPLSESRWIVRSLGAKDFRGTLTLGVRTDYERERVRDLLRSGARLGLTRESEQDMHCSRVDVPPLWFRPSSETVLEEPMIGSHRPHATFTFSWVAQ